MRGEEMAKPSSIKGLKKGDIVSLTVVTDVSIIQGEYTVESRNRYAQEGGYEWFEIKLEDGPDEELWLEWEEDDEFEIGLNLRRVPLNELGLSRTFLEQLDEEGEGSFTYKGIEYELDESDEALFYRHGAGEGIPFHYWDFEDREGEHFIGIERWGKGEIEVHIGIYIEESDIEIYPS
jgi:hypothetical protein